MKINKLEIENVKRVRALTLEPSANGLTVIGTQLPANLCPRRHCSPWRQKYRPGSPVREGA